MLLTNPLHPTLNPSPYSWNLATHYLHHMLWLWKTKRSHQLHTTTQPDTRAKPSNKWSRKAPVISLETAVWCSALHTTNNMETGLGVAKLWVQPQYVRSVGCLIWIWRGFRRTALNQRWGKGLHWGAWVFWEEELDRSGIQWRTEMERFRWERMMRAMKGQWERHNKRRCYTGAPRNYTQRPKRRNKRIPKRRLKTGAMSWNNFFFFYRIHRASYTKKE